MSKEQTKWTKLRAELNGSYDYDDNWLAAINLFTARLKDKFFDPIQKIVDAKKFKGEGFAILAVQCALIEFLAAFRSGRIFNHNAGKNSPQYEYRGSAKLYVDFLHTANTFENVFYTSDANGNKTLDQPFDANLFYSQVRCGLLHEARTKGKWTVNVKKNSRKEKVFVVQDGQKKRIYRTVLNYRLKDYLNSYCEELKQSNNQELRRLFARKLDDLFDMSPDPKKFDWWIDK